MIQKEKKKKKTTIKKSIVCPLSVSLSSCVCAGVRMPMSLSILQHREAYQRIKGKSLARRSRTRPAARQPAAQEHAAAEVPKAPPRLRKSLSPRCTEAGITRNEDNKTSGAGATLILQEPTASRSVGSAAVGEGFLPPERGLA